MTNRERIARQIPLMILWAMLSALVWSFVFNIITDTDPTRKLTLFADAETPGAAELAAELEKETGAGIRMVKVHPFSYAMLNGDALREADLYIVTASGAETYRDWFIPLPETLRDRGEMVSPEGVPVGVRVWNAGTRTGIAADWLSYPAEEDAFLCLGKTSLHVLGLEGAADDEAVDAALRFLALPERTAAGGQDQTQKEEGT